ncbi:MAG: hypothetical protein U0531_20010 [Dehalococcoidia bacterium]
MVTAPCSSSGRAPRAGDERLDATWTHQFFGDLNWRARPLFLRIHDLDHARQLTAIAAALATYEARPFPAFLVPPSWRPTRCPAPS